VPSTWVYANPSDYAPGQLANLYAGGFQTGASVDFQIINVTKNETYQPSWAVADGSADTTFTTNTQGSLGNRAHTYADEGTFTVNRQGHEQEQRRR
jgi:hypothetical protein